MLLLQELVKKNYRCIAITSDSNITIETPSLTTGVLHENYDGVDLYWLKTFKYKKAKSLRRVLGWLHFEWNLFFFPKKQLPKPDTVIVSSLSLLTIFNGLVLKKKYKCKLLFEVRDIWPLTIVEEGEHFSYNNPLVKILGLIEKLAYKKADHIIGTMPNLGEHVKNILGYDKPTTCIPMGVEPQNFSNPTPLSEEYINTYLKKDGFKIFYSGTIGISNALEIFFEAARHFNDNPNIHFILLGNGSLKEEYQKKFGHLRSITFAPRVNRDQVQEVLSHADVLYFSTFPSKVWQYGQSLTKITDYMLAGKPILASYSGYPSMINEAGCGEFIPAGDLQALIEAIESYANKSSNDLKDMGLRGLSWILENRKFSNLANKIEEIL